MLQACFQQLIRTMRNRALLLVTSAIALSITTAVHAATYFVATTGSASNPGTLSQPLDTINHGVAKLTAAGDILYVRGGTYHEHVLIWNKVGTSTSQYYVEPYNGESVTIDGTSVSGSYSGLVEIDDSAYLNFNSFTVENSATAGIIVYDAHHINVRWNDVHDNTKYGITATGDSVGDAHDLLFDGNDIHHNVLENASHTASPWAQALSCFKCDTVTFSNNYVTENYGEGIDAIVTDHATIKNNHVWDNWSADIYLDNAQYSTVDSNFVTTGYGDNPTDFYRDSHPAAAIVIANETYSGIQNPATDLTITNNIVLWCYAGVYYGNWQEGGGLHHTLIANNTIYEATYAGLWFDNATSGSDIHDTTTVDNNVVLQASGVSYVAAPCPTDTHPTDPNAPDRTCSGITYRTNAWYGGASGTSRTGTGDVTSNPLLVNAGGGSDTDYKLSSTSPCKTAGTTETAVAKDYWGTTRTASYSIGAHEY
jgi:hypothetical protein